MERELRLARVQQHLGRGTGGEGGGARERARRAFGKGNSERDSVRRIGREGWWRWRGMQEDLGRGRTARRGRISGKGGAFSENKGQKVIAWVDRAGVGWGGKGRWRARRAEALESAAALSKEGGISGEGVERARAGGRPGGVAAAGEGARGRRGGERRRAMRRQWRKRLV